MQRMYVVPRYDPVFVEPNLKEYETQVYIIIKYVNENIILLVMYEVNPPKKYKYFHSIGIMSY